MMTFQTLLLDPFKGMFAQVIEFVPTLITLFFVLIIGLLLTKFVHMILGRLVKELKFDRLFDTIGLSDLLKKGGINSLGELMVNLLTTILLIIFVMIGVRTVGLPGGDALDRILGYVPHALMAVVILMLGHVVAKFISSLVYIVAGMMELPKPELLKKISHFGIILYVITLVIEELGYGFLLVGTPLHILLTGVALGIGLGIKDYVSRSVDRV